MIIWAGFGLGIILCVAFGLLELVRYLFISMFGYEAGPDAMMVIMAVAFLWVAIFPPNWLRKL